MSNIAAVPGLFDPPAPGPEPCEHCRKPTRVTLASNGKAPIPCCGEDDCVEALLGESLRWV